MADNTETSEMGNFSIQDTISKGAGSQELLNDLLGSETTGADPDTITEITKDIKDEVTEDVITTSETEGKSPDNKEDKKEKPDTSIADFLASAPGDDDDDVPSDGVLPGKGEAPKSEEPEAPESEDTEDDTPSSGTPFETLSKELTELGVFTEQEGEEPISTPEQFLEKFQTEKQAGASQIVENFIGQFGEDYQNAFDAIFVKGADPKEYFGALSKVSDFTNMDLTSEANQKLVLRQALTDQGFEGEDINLEIERLNNYGDLETVAERHHRVLVKKETEKLKTMEAEAQQALQNKTAIKNVYINNVQETLTEKLKEKGFDGIPLNPKLANELHDFLLVDKYKTPSGETLTDFDRTILDLKRPENHATKVKIGLLLKILEKDPTLSTIQKTGITKKANKMFTEVARQVTKPGNINKSTNGAAKSWFK
jgi:hypothetical protein